MKPRYDHTIRWLQYTSNCNFPLWKLKELRVKVVSILGEGGEGALSSERWGDPAILARVCQLRAAPWCATISWPACLLATHTRSSCTFSLTLSVKSSQVNWRQALRENYCACSWSLSSKNDKKMISCARVYWICHLDSWIFHPGLCFISFQKKFNYPVPSHFQFSGRDGSGTGIPSVPAVYPSRSTTILRLHINSSALQAEWKFENLLYRQVYFPWDSSHRRLQHKSLREKDFREL